MASQLPLGGLVVATKPTPLQRVVARSVSPENGPRSVTEKAGHKSPLES